MEIKLNTSGIWEYFLKYFTWPYEIGKAIFRAITANKDSVKSFLLAVFSFIFFGIGFIGLIFTGISIYEGWGIFWNIIIPLGTGALMWATGDFSEWVLDKLGLRYLLK